MNTLRISFVVLVALLPGPPLAGQTPREELARLKTRIKKLEAENQKLEQRIAAQALAESVKVWTDAGSSVTWVKKNPASGIIDVWPLATEDRDGAMPVFRFTWWKIRDRTPTEVAQLPGIRGNGPLKTADLIDHWKDGMLADLPDPGTAFGLDLGSTGYGAPVTDMGLKGVAGLKSLKWLNLYNTRVGDLGLKELARLKSLQTLVLSGTQVTDTGLKELAGLTSLQALDLQFTLVTDAGLEQLAGLKRLQFLNLSQVRNVTAAGVAALQKKLPACKIHR